MSYSSSSSLNEALESDCFVSFWLPGSGNSLTGISSLNLETKIVQLQVHVHYFIQTMLKFTSTIKGEKSELVKNAWPNGLDYFFFFFLTFKQLCPIFFSEHFQEQQGWLRTEFPHALLLHYA